MKIKKLIQLLGILIVIISCTQPSSNDSESEFSIITETESLGSTPQDVYFIFTNSSSSTTKVAPEVNNNTRNLDSNLAQDKEEITYTSNRFSHSYGIIEEIREYESLPINFQYDNSRTVSSPVFSYTEFPDNPNVDSKDFYISNTGSTTVRSTNRYYETMNNGTKDITLSIWVADESWVTGGSKNDLITSEMITALASSFLIAGPGNDIYDWVTGIYGEPWGDQPYPYLLPLAAADNITILLYDIDNDDADAITNGGTVGYFWSKDNFKYNAISDPGSNERIMFYIDSSMFAHADDLGPWEVADSWPSTVISTLAHEFQHMIHFYQKQILNGISSSTDTWINEMCSLVTEDFLSNKLNVTGPRGLINAGDAGNYPIDEGRLPLFNYWNENSFMIWDYNDSDLVLRDYSSAYAFGAFLARNYGGAALFQQIVQSSFTDENALVNAVNTINSTNLDFKDLLVAWGEAAIHTSDTTYTPGYNTGAYFTSDLNGITYNLGSIDLNNYDPQIFFYDSNWVMQEMGPGTNILYKAGSNLTGEQSWNLIVPRGVTVTTVLMDS
ncbi:M30 family zinc metallopeptidase [Spirochaeta isovalerica]|uniref:Peptidase M30 n=1 Tax=Spirochaeta isovalerica TaxID=150 RepID=A0A841R8Z9_9SPIO|nr:hypothetical protein [Spirochaeta isovalerica]MBB6478952.1 hypothetical protein [Spirochaeta isovalerica]